jgi:dimethylaniline monooxygenase (N-oxide forming)
MNFQGMKGVVMENWPDQLTSDISPMVPDDDVRLAGIGYTSGYVDSVRSGKLSVQSGIESVEGTTVKFTNGNQDDFDVIVCATGFEPDLSILPEEVQNKFLTKNAFNGTNVCALYKHTLVPGIDNLALLGYYNNIGPLIPGTEMQARYVSALWSGKLPRPSETKIQAGQDAYKQHIAAGPHNSALVIFSLAEDLGDELGLTPSYFTAFWNASKLLTGPLYQVYYRTNPAIEGAEKAEKAKLRFEMLLANPVKVDNSKGESIETIP